MSVKSINITVIKGGLTRDAELKYTQGGYAYLSFSLAYTRTVKKGDSWEDKSCYIDCTLWGKRAEALAQYMTKGKQVVVAGELDHQTWETDGQKRSKHALMVNDINLMSSGGNNNNSSSQPAPQQKPPVDYDPNEVPF